MTRQWQTKASDVDWEGVRQDVLTRISLLRAAWEASERDAPPELHAKMVEDLYGPAFELLGRFCACVEIENKAEDAP